MNVKARTTKRYGRETRKLRKNNDQGHFEIDITLRKCMGLGAFFCCKSSTIQMTNKLRQWF